MRAALFRPPVIAGVGFDPTSIPRQHLAPGHEHGFQVIQEGPEPRGRLEFGGGRRQKDEVDALGHVERAGGVPAPSSTSTARGVASIPWSAAKAARTVLITWLVTVGTSAHQRWPVRGRTTPNTYSHWSRRRTQAGGRCPRLAQTRRRTGSRPRRCSSIAHRLSVASGWAARTASTWAWSPRL